MPSRRKFLGQALTLASLPASVAAAPPTTTFKGLAAEKISLDGLWLFQPDPDNIGENQHFQDGGHTDWRTVSVPHTWQIEASLAEYRGPAWYFKTFDTPTAAAESFLRLEFEAVFHSARVWVNGAFAGEHLRKGYTAFSLDLTNLKAGGANTIAIRVDNTFDSHMLPRGRSSDWAHDGGIYRPVNIWITPAVFVDRLDVDAIPDLVSGQTRIETAIFIRNTTLHPWTGHLAVRVIDDATGLVVLEESEAATVSIKAGQTLKTDIKTILSKAKLWHFDEPNLYRIEVAASSGHCFTTTFGIRTFEVKGTAFYLNGERVTLMGVERMAGSNPRFGMAETAEWITHDHDDLRHLNCIFTRVHWPQDRRVLDYCDRHGILIQTEVPTWGPDTFKNMGAEADLDIMENGREQLREMLARDRNHPCICSWGLCNEIGGQNAPAYNFAKNMLAEAKRLDPRRLCSYASHSLRETPANDVAGLMDFIECNEYFGSWQKGDASDLARSMDSIHAAFPDKPIVISEYGYCACTDDRPEGDERRREILRTQDVVFRERDYIAGLIFFCYNDYRTHVGDRGAGVLRQRVHGVVDLFGKPKPSYELLRAESSPVQSISISGHPTDFEVTIRSRKLVPAYTLRHYTLRSVLYGSGEIPVEQFETALQDLVPGQEVKVNVAFAESRPYYVQFEVFRPTGSSAYSLRWQA